MSHLHATVTRQIPSNNERSERRRDRGPHFKSNRTVFAVDDAADCVGVEEGDQAQEKEEHHGKDALKRGGGGERYVALIHAQTIGSKNHGYT